MMGKKPIFKIPQTIKEDTKKYEKNVGKFLKGQLSPERFKGYRVPMGVYGQRSQTEEKEKYMVRVRIPAGYITKEQLKVLSDISRQYGQGFIHFTTRQDIQIHRVDIEDTPKILYKLLSVNLSPRGGGGNTVRNIANSSRAGVNPQEAFDTTPHALALSEYLLKSRSSFNLPRKYKIAFSSSSEDEALATINDLGFIAKKTNGKKWFKVYAAGGMGNSPQIGLLLAQYIEEDKIFHVAEAIKRLFDDYGNRKNKHQARLRFVRKKLGDKKFIDLYQKYYREILKENLDIEKINCFKIEREELKDKVKINQNIIKAEFVYPEKVEGYYSLELSPQNGDLTADEVNSLLEIVNDNNISIRTNNKQGLLIRGIKASNLKDMITEIRSINKNLLVEAPATRPIACKGAATCRLGLCLSPELAREIGKRLKTVDLEVRKALPRIYISGCPNSCGQHHIGKIGFEGKARRYDGRLIPCYSLLLGGKIEEDQSQYGEKTITLPARRIPDFMIELARELYKDPEYKKNKFNQYLKNKGKKKIKNLAVKYTNIPEYNQEPEFYKDWGQKEDFSLAGRGPGECGTGVLDIVKLDINRAEETYKQGIENNDNQKLYQAVINAARALLIVRGVDTEKDRVVISEFKNKLIEEDLVAPEFKKLLDKTLDYKLEENIDLLESSEQIKTLIERVNKLFESLDSSLNFNLQEEKSSIETEENSAKENKNNLKDLRGVKCPLNFVKAKLFIEPLADGEKATFYLDKGEPIKNVPRSLEAEGHVIIEISKHEDGYFILKVKKKGDQNDI